MNLPPPAACVGTDQSPNGKTLSQRVRTLVADLDRLGPRPTGTVTHAAAGALLERALWSAEALPYRGETMLIPHHSGVANLVGMVPGRDRHRRPLVLATHYDGPDDSHGAGDNAAAVALAVALCPLLRQRRLERTVVIALLDAGDPASVPAAARGAELFVHEQRRHDLKAALVVDRVGHRTAPSVPPLLVVGAESDPRLPSALAQLHEEGPEVAPVRRSLLEHAAALDAFRDGEIPALWLTAGHAPHHRGPDDRPHHLDDELLAGTARHVVTLLERLSCTRLPAPSGEHDVSSYERSAWGRWSAEGALDDRGLQRLVRSVLPRLTFRTPTCRPHVPPARPNPKAPSGE